MTDKNFYIMLADTPWADPISTILKGPDIMVNDGVLLPDVPDRYEIVLSVEKKPVTHRIFRLATFMAPPVH